jgi:hypothetical protein
MGIHWLLKYDLPDYAAGVVPVCSVQDMITVIATGRF